MPYIKLISVQKHETFIPEKFLSSPVLRSLIELLALEGKTSLSSSESNSPYFFLSTNMGCIFKVSLESKFQNYNWNRHLMTSNQIYPHNRLPPHLRPYDLRGSLNVLLQAIAAKLADKTPLVVGSKRKAAALGSIMIDVTWAKFLHCLLNMFFKNPLWMKQRYWTQENALQCVKRKTCSWLSSLS